MKSKTSIDPNKYYVVKTEQSTLCAFIALLTTRPIYFCYMSSNTLIVRFNNTKPLCDFWDSATKLLHINYLEATKDSAATTLKFL